MCKSRIKEEPDQYQTFWDDTNIDIWDTNNIQQRHISQKCIFDVKFLYKEANIIL